MKQRCFRMMSSMFACFHGSYFTKQVTAQQQQWATLGINSTSAAVLGMNYTQMVQAAETLQAILSGMSNPSDHCLLHG